MFVFNIACFARSGCAETNKVCKTSVPHSEPRVLQKLVPVQQKTLCSAVVELGRSQGSSLGRSWSRSQVLVRSGTEKYELGAVMGHVWNNRYLTSIYY